MIFLLYKYTAVNARDGEEFFKLNDNSGTRTTSSECVKAGNEQNASTQVNLLNSLLMGIV